MTSTKIINVLKDDKFEEILDLFRNTSAKEVIFVLPKTSKVFKNEEHFAVLDNEASKSDKKISLLCSNPDINNLAKKYKFDVLLTQKTNSKPGITTVNQLSHNAPTDDDESDKENDEYQVVTISKINKKLEDVVRQKGKFLRVDSEKEKPVGISLKKKITYRSEDEIKNVWKEQSERIQNENIWTGINNRTKKSFKNFPKKSLIGLCVISIVTLGTIIYISTGSAKIDITPHKKPIDIKLKVSASDKFSSVDVKLNKIPGQLFNIEKTVTQTFATTGEKEVAQKARGKITVFNEYGTTPQPLIATTRFQTLEGLIFRTLKGITVPGTKVENGKIIPGSIRVEVIADKPGQSYNISANRFNIPAFKERGDTGRYEKIYGKSDETMKGGAIGKAKVVTESDFNTAKQTLSEQVEKNVEDSLKNQTSGLKVINASAVKLKEPESTAKIDEVADNFIMTVSGSIKTVGFKEDDLKDLIKQFIDKTQNLTVVPEKLTISYENIMPDEVGNSMTFIVNIKGVGYSKIDSDKIKKDLSGKNEKEIKDYFKETVATSVESARVVLSPFWVKRVPQDNEKTSIRINY